MAGSGVRSRRKRCGSGSMPPSTATFRARASGLRRARTWWWCRRGRRTCRWRRSKRWRRRCRWWARGWEGCRSWWRTASPGSWCHPTTRTRWRRPSPRCCPTTRCGWRWAPRERRGWRRTSARTAWRGGWSTCTKSWAKSWAKSRARSPARSGAGGRETVRVLQVIQQLEPGGAERLVLTLAERLEADGHVVDIAAEPGPRAESLGLPDHALPGRLERRPHRLPAAAWAVRGALRRSPADVVHAHNPGMAAAVALATRRGRRPPALVTSHGVPPEDDAMTARVLRLAGLPVVACGPGVAAGLASGGVE